MFWVIVFFFFFILYIRRILLYLSWPLEKFYNTYKKCHFTWSFIGKLSLVNHLIVLSFFVFYVTAFGSLLHLYKVYNNPSNFNIWFGSLHLYKSNSQGLMLENMTRLMTWWSKQISFLLSSLRLSFLIIKKNVKESPINCLKLKTNRSHESPAYIVDYKV